ncbi:hypothetical protein [Brunnivagina elsteri]|uniref:Uncharacterized protein n=1 Tax=Brunnivagina elsteri CCALA 953 TaxID=987040 RepID=A0A2A2TMT1_9CYAN|nr:hypothetical protein [Calothrix elsteri]PAX59856.1 hypothetical protein CK510_04960 [Calothrix elsteri CCALA 953]
MIEKGVRAVRGNSIEESGIYPVKNSNKPGFSTQKILIQQDKTKKPGLSANDKTRNNAFYLLCRLMLGY